MFKNLLKELRLEKRITQPQLAEAIGVSKGNVGDWETGKSKPGYTALVALAKYFDVTADFLLGLDTRGQIHEKARLVGATCDGMPLTESEADLIAMYRLIEEGDQKTIFDLTKLKYEQMIGEKESIYSTYSDTKEQQKSHPETDKKSSHGIA